ncbi:MAG: hypothetical protein A2157_10490 [Deltaproteobacteria bacterium RBG_16_47_11]|nr:MAG: hypothetical protein A2157_10490 [Deltaproteobacteria bacterium RBG_16_47_11]
MIRKLITILFSIPFLFLPLHGNAQQAATIQIYLFYAVDCPDCQGILESYVPTLKSSYPFLDIKTFDIANPSYYEALSKLEEKFNRRGNELPVLFIGDNLLSGQKEITERLDPLILEYQMKGGITSLPLLEIPSTAKPSDKAFSVDLAYFYQKGCQKCDRVSYQLKYLIKKYPGLNVKEIDLDTPDGKRLNETLSNRLNLPQEKRLIAPSIFIGKDCLSFGEITESSVEALIQKYGKVGTQSFLEVTKGEIKKAEESMVDRFKSLGVLNIVIAGFINGCNPCAFATLIFFISYLTMVGRNRREIFWVGMGFSATVFVTYLLIGLGILSFIQHLSFLPLLCRVVYLITLGFALVLGIYSFYDYILLKRGRPSEMKLQIPNVLKKRIHKIIREGGQSSRYLLAAVVAGFIISILQFTCTGQVYLPTILFVINTPSLRTSAVSYLLLYNFMFILPLLIIFGIVYWGVTSEQLSFFLQRRATTIKLLTSLFFFFLAGILIVSLL